MTESWKFPSKDELFQIRKSLDRAGLSRDIGQVSLMFDRQGRFTICLMYVGGRFRAWGAARLDSADTDDPEVGRRIALAKACRGLVAWLKDREPLKKERQEAETSTDSGDLKRLCREGGGRAEKVYKQLLWMSRRGATPLYLVDHVLQLDHILDVAGRVCVLIEGIGLEKQEGEFDPEAFYAKEGLLARKPEPEPQAGQGVLTDEERLKAWFSTEGPEKEPGIFVHRDKGLLRVESAVLRRVVKIAKDRAQREFSPGSEAEFPHQHYALGRHDGMLWLASELRRLAGGAP